MGLEPQTTEATPALTWQDVEIGWQQLEAQWTGVMGGHYAARPLN